jgi:sulfur carrier protein
VRLILNGEEKLVEGVQTIADLISRYRLNERIVIVEHNRSIVPKEAYASTCLCEGDQIEIVHFVGGG